MNQDPQIQDIVKEKAVRLRKVREQLKLTQNEFGVKIGMDQGAITKHENARRPIGNNVEYKLLKEFNINEVWWNTGSGDMFNSDSNKPEVQAIKGIAYYEDIDVTAGAIDLFTDGSLEPTAYMQIPHFEDCDRAFPLWGDSMAPVYQSGQIVMCKEFLSWRDYVPYGEVFLVVTDSLRTVKYVKRASSDDKYLLVSENPHFDPFEVSKEHIRRMFIVKGSVKRNMI